MGWRNKAAAGLSAWEIVTSALGVENKMSGTDQKASQASQVRQQEKESTQARHSNRIPSAPGQRPAKK